MFQHDLSISPLKEISELRASNVQLIVDDSLGVGCLGANLKGTVEYQGLTMKDIDILCASLEFICDSVGGFVVGKYSVIDKQRLLGNGYTFSASAPPFTCTAAKYAIEDFARRGTKLSIELTERRNLFNSIVKETNKVKIIGNEVLPYVLLNCEGKNEELVRKLRDKDFYVCTQHHLEEDWCKNNYVRVNLSKNFTEERMKEFANVLSQM